MTKVIMKNRMKSSNFNGRKASSLIPIMQDIQAEYRYLPGELLTYVAKEIGVREAKAYSCGNFL